jgi:hypothetical protein
MTIKLLRPFYTAFTSSKHNEITLNIIYIPKYSGPLNNNTVCKVYKINSQFQGNFQNIFDFVNDR